MFFLIVLTYTNIFSQEKQFININEAKILSSVRIGNIYFEDITFSSEMINNSIFNDCYFIKVKFKNLTLYGNIFQDCTFEDCEEIDFEKLKKLNNHFINCTNDGEKI